MHVADKRLATIIAAIHAVRARSCRRAVAFGEICSAGGEGTGFGADLEVGNPDQPPRLRRVEVQDVP
jgi:hypothetical protein